MFVDTSSIAYEVRLREVEYDGRGPAVGGRGRGRLATPVLQQSRPALRLVRRDVVPTPQSGMSGAVRRPHRTPQPQSVLGPVRLTIQRIENRFKISIFR